MSQAIADEIGKMIDEIEHLVQHPRIQQKTWVAKGRHWLPILRIAKAHLEAQTKDVPTTKDEASP